ncbi:MAG TPA: prepilin-type N-terminal cleavage/methylation domain-containing protein [Chthoniobacteraceae bacterium]|nr:prepilin-type N-terminal cleavage/methylation domain-containing protein [Chthoniobacteraceae bacterium]
MPPMLIRKPARRAFSLLEILLAVAVVAVLMLLALPLTRQALDRSRSVQCVANLRTLHVAIGSYAADHQMRFPANPNVDPEKNLGTRKSWYLPLREYLPAPQADKKSAYFCPANEADHLSGSPSWTNYGMNAYLFEDIVDKYAPPLRFSDVDGSKVLLVDSYQKVESGFGTWYIVSGPGANWKWIEGIHHGRVNTLFTDGRVESLLVSPRVIDPKTRDLGEFKAGWFTPVRR